AGKAHRFCIFGAGTAGTGIADQICRAIAVREGLSEDEIRRNFYLIDRNGLLQSNHADLLYFQKPYARSHDELRNWKVSNPDRITLLETVLNARPTVLIGCSAVAGAFTDEVIAGMLKNTGKPLIMPLSNPTEKAETTPLQILKVTQGKALIATGSPFGNVTHDGRKIEISQCNNALIFPGIGLGMIISRARSLSDEMLLAASECLGRLNRADDNASSLLPGFAEIQKISDEVAMAVARQAFKEGLAPAVDDTTLLQRIIDSVWKPCYADYITSNE
ncbi:MAG: NAD-dependent malic enzyme, partial [Candidatus Riflebacteria bacterium]|nr:NAD-dependent malic enzyme [Candidatus Riflebacteria bacterium]